MTATSDIAEASLSRIATCTFNSPKKRLCPVSFQSEDLHLSKKINVDDRTGERFLQAKGLLNSRGPQKTSPSLLPSKQPEISLVCSSPRIFLIKDFLCQEDCQGLITLATPLLQTSMVASGTCVPGRTSSSMFLHGAHEQEPCVIGFDRKVHHLLQMPAVQAENLSMTEAIQISQYKEGQFYDAHFDNKSEECWRRAATLITYLNDVEEGGATFFPHASIKARLEYSVSKPGSGLRIRPKRGCAIMFWSRSEDGSEDPASLHAAEKVVRGEKWICSRWFKAPSSCLAGDDASYDNPRAPEP